MPVKSDSPARAAARTRFAPLAEDPDPVPDHAKAVDPDNPSMTDEQLARLRPAAEVHPALVEAKRRGGRPRSEAPKVAVSVRLDADLVDALRASGDGWQSRLNETLRRELGLDDASTEADDVTWLEKMGQDLVRRILAGDETAADEVERFTLAVRGRAKSAKLENQPN